MKKRIAPQILAALLAPPALTAALLWYYNVYIDWQPNLYPLATAAAILGNALLTLLALRVRGERKAARLAWKTALSTIVFAVALIGVSLVVNNVIFNAEGPGPRTAAAIALPLAAAQLLVLFVLLLQKLRKPAVAVCLIASCLFSFTGMVAMPYYMDNLYRAPVPVLPEGKFSPMPVLNEVNFTVPIDGSIEEVRDLIREAREDGNEKHFTVLIEDGEYNITQIAFDERDYNTTYRSRDGGVILNGGMRLDPKDFTPWDKNKNIKVIDLTALGLTADDWGKLHGFGAYSTAHKYDDAAGPLPCELFFNGKRMTTARYPNGGKTLKIKGVIDNGDSQETYENWITHVNPEWEAMRNPRGGIFTMDQKTTKRAASWASYDNVWIFGCFQFDWADMSNPVKAIDTKKGTLTTEHASTKGFAIGGTYYFFNLLEELDEPGEWFLDRDAGLLYLWPPKGDFDSAGIELSLSTETLITGENLKNMRFIGLTLQGTRGDAMVLAGDDITVSHCLVRNIAGSAISVTGYNNNVSNNEICYVGARGITIDGGEAETLTPGNSRAVNNLVHDWSEVVMTYQGGVNVNGTGNLVAHNEFYNSPHTAIFFRGNNHVIEYNLIHDVCLLTDDAGAIYNGCSWWSAQGTVIRNNVIYNLGSGGFRPNGVYLDDGLSGITVDNNLLVNVPGRVIALGGRDLDVRGNVIVNGGRPVNYDDAQLQMALEGREHSYASEGGPLWQDLFASPWQTEVWRAAFPKLAAVTSNFSDTGNPNFAPNPAGSDVSGNTIVGPGKPFYAETALRFSKIGPNDEYGFWKSRRYWTLPGYENIPLGLVGRVGQ